MKVEVLAAIPVPVGHRVSVSWYHKNTKTTSIFDEEVDESHDDQPLVEDLDTGIVYAFDWLYDTTSDASFPTMSELGTELRKGIEEQRVVVGRVGACRIFTVPLVTGRLQGSYRTQTELTIAPDDETSPHR